MSTVAWNLRSIVSCAAKQIDTPNASRLPSQAADESIRVAEHDDDAERRQPSCATHVRMGTGSFSTRRPEMAARNGDTLISTNALATVVCVSDAMKKKNVPERTQPGQGDPAGPKLRTARRHAVGRASPVRTAADECRHEQRAPEDDFPRAGDGQLADQDAAGRPADRGDDHEQDGAAMARGCIVRRRGQRRMHRNRTGTEPVVSKRRMPASLRRRTPASEDPINRKVNTGRPALSNGGASDPDGGAPDRATRRQIGTGVNPRKQRARLRQVGEFHVVATGAVAVPQRMDAGIAVCGLDGRRGSPFEYLEQRAVGGPHDIGGTVAVTRPSARSVG